MRPLELTIKGFRSFADRIEIDWRGRRLVGVVGPIGSGKTSILDAVAFALYGKTPVFSSESKTLIRHGSDSARVELAFESAGELWRVIRVIRHNGAGRHVLYRDEETLTSPVCEKEREVTAKIEELLGLDFPTFCRSVLLAQNRFAEFLNASPGDRDKVLKGVFGFDRLDGMQALARERRSKAALRLKELQGRLATLDDDERRLEEARRALDLSDAQRRRFEDVAETVRELRNRESEAQRRAEDAGRKRVELDELAGQLPCAGEVEELVGATERAAAELGRREETGRRVRERLVEAEAALRTTQDEVGTAEDHARAESRLDTLRQARTLLERRRARRCELERSASDQESELARARAALVAAGEEEQRCRESAETAASHLRQAQEERTAVESQIGGHAAISEAHGELQKLRLARAELEREIEGRRRVEERLRAAADDLARLSSQRDHAVAEEADAATRQRRAAQELARAEEAQRHASHAEMALALAATLEPGKPCPVCDQPVRAVQSKLFADEEGDTVRVLEDARQAEKQAGSRLFEAGKEAAKLRQMVENVERNRDQDSAALAEAESAVARREDEAREIEVKLTSLPGEGAPEIRLMRAEERMAGAEARLREREAEERAAAECLRDAAHSVELARQQADAAAATLSATAKQLEDAKAEIEEGAVALREAGAQVEELLGSGDPEERLNLARSRLAQAEATLGAAQEELGEAVRQVDEGRRFLETSRQAQERLASRLAGLAGQLGHVNDAGSEALTPRQLNHEVVRRLEEARRAAANSETEALEDQRRDRDERQRIHAGLELEPDADFDTALAAVRAAYARDGATVSELEERLAKAEELRGERRQAEADHTLYVQLAEDLSASKFLRYLLEQERAALADLGSERFEMLSEGRYRFTHDGAFQVIDQHNANAVRKADTLSGGETFLASLALALALAEKVTAGGGRLDAFFLDEGFGSLDPEHLTLAMEGIERLVTDSPNRLVTVVSHVPEMRERIEDLIELDKDPLTGSTILKQGATRSL